MVTALNNTYLPFLKQPIIVYETEDFNQMQRAFKFAKERELDIGIYSYALFATMTEDDNLKTIASPSDDEQELVGLVIYGDVKK